MTPRLASLRVAHSRSCALRVPRDVNGKTVTPDPNAIETVKAGCTCKPGYYVSWRDANGNTHKSKRVRDRRTADKMLREQQVEIDKGRVEYHEVRNVTFPELVAEFLENGRTVGLKKSTLSNYKETLDVAEDVFGHVTVRAIGVPEIRKFYGQSATASRKPKNGDEPRPLATETRMRELRQLGVCMSYAVTYGYADRNPVPEFRATLPKSAKKRKKDIGGTPPFTDGELARLYVALGDEEPVYLAVVKAAVETGARVGELAALDWDRLNLTAGTLDITHTYSARYGLTSPKDGDERTVFLTPAALTVFEEWAARHEPDVSGPMFLGPREKRNADGTPKRLDVGAARKVLHRALTAAGVALDDEKGRKRKPWHSLRATYTRRQLEAGRLPQWVQRNLGHAGLELTIGVYGEWTDEAMRAEAIKPAGALPV